MSDQMPDTTGGKKADELATQREGPGIPRWLRLSGIAVLAIILLVVVLQLVNGGEHGPGRHTGSSSEMNESPFTSTPEVLESVNTLWGIA